MSDNQQFCLRWNNHQSTLVQVIDSLLSSGVLVDCTLAAEGQFLHAHKVVLCACSPYLETLLSQHYEKHPIVILKDVKFQELKSMMDYMYKGEVNISQDQLGQFLKAAESLQIKGLTDGGGGENDSRDVGSTSQKRHEPAPVRKSIPHNQSRSPVVLPPHTSGLTIEPSKRTLPHLSESQPDSPIRSREGSTSPTPRKRRRPRRLSQGDDDSHADNSCDLPMQPQSMSITSVPSSIPPLPSGSSSTITKAPPPDDDSENPESDRLSGLPEGLIKEKIEPQSEMLIEPKTEYMDETNNDDSVEDLTLDDDDDYDGMMEAGAGPSHGGNNPNENYAAWQQITGDRQDDAYLNPADTGHRDSQEELLHLEDQSKSPYITTVTSLSAAGSQCQTISPDYSIRRINETASEVNMKDILSYIQSINKSLEALPLISTSLNDIKMDLDMLKNRVDYAVINEETNVDFEQLFPIQSGKVFLAMNEQLSNDSTFRMNFLQYVARVCKCNPRASPKVKLTHLLKALFHENFTRHANWSGFTKKTGSASKIGVKSSLLIKLLVDYVDRTYAIDSAQAITREWFRITNATRTRYHEGKRETNADKTENQEQQLQ